MRAMQQQSLQLLHIAVPVPLYQRFSYLTPKEFDTERLSSGMRIKVSFGPRKLVGILLEVETLSPEALAALEKSNGYTFKPASAIIDVAPILSPNLLKLMSWCASYYKHPIGETLAAALPTLLKRGDALPPLSESFVQLVPAHQNYQARSNAHAQLAIIAAINKYGRINDDQIKQLKLNRTALNTMHKKGVLEAIEQPLTPRQNISMGEKLPLNDEQQVCLDAFNDINGTFKPVLLEGITGSGKTEVYLQMIEQILLTGKQALILVPEIGLTPQTTRRFEQRFDCPIAMLHSHLSDKARLQFWQQAKAGIAKIIIGTRSALFTATDNLGLIIIDEEHDISYKQQDGLHYSARDVGIMRAKIENIPIILASATPSLESLYNSEIQRFDHWQLTQRAGHAQTVDLQLLDIRNQTLFDGISEQALPYIKDCIDKGEQALIFINRRGFAPTLLCHDCAWICECDACDQRMTIHFKAGHMRCHQCQSLQAIARNCPRCKSDQLIFQGTGSQRIETFCQQQFPNTDIFRIDRDSTTTQKQMNAVLNKIQENKPAIMIGTQMLAKGHHFPNVTLVLIVEGDAGLMSTDYRAMERFGQLLIQVTGRAGREAKKGLALIQTHYPDHPDLNRLLSHGYQRFALDLLATRKQCGLPPFTYQALIRLEDKNPQQAQQTLLQLQRSFAHIPCISIGPYPAELQRRAHFYRYQLLIQANKRSTLQQATSLALTASSTVVNAKQRFSIDIDPQQMA